VPGKLLLSQASLEFAGIMKHSHEDELFFIFWMIRLVTGQAERGHLHQKPGRPGGDHEGP
jgi:hypothetical protein